MQAHLEKNLLLTRDARVEVALEAASMKGI
jgi:hypothetical protein